MWKRKRTRPTGSLRLTLRLVQTTGLVLLLTTCAAEPAGDRVAVGQLEELGYFAYTPPEALEATRGAVAGSSFPFYDEGSGRFFFADAEDLAEGGVGSFLESLRPTLEQLGVDLGEVADRWSAEYDRYSVLVAGREYLIWGPDEQEEARALGAVRAFALVNELLAATGTEERLYAVGGDNDMIGTLLTPSLAEHFSARADTYGQPYLPRNEPPWFGMPH